MCYNLFDESRMRGAKNMSVTSNVFKTVGLAFAITNYLKGFFFRPFSRLPYIAERLTQS